MYDLTVNFTISKRTTLTLPTLTHVKAFVKAGILDSSLKSLDDVVSVKQGDTIKQLVDVSKWFFESYYSSHANKEQKLYIESKYNFKG